MKFRAYLAALAAAAAGAGIWAAISYYANYEIGYVAWGIGALVGGTAYGLGGRGPVSGGTAALLSLLAIFGGKAIAMDLAIDRDLATLIDEPMYEELMMDAEAYPGSEDRVALRAFIVEHGFYDTAGPAEVAEFLEYWDEDLERWRVEEPTYSEWRSERRGEISVIEGVRENLGPFDLIFIVLGVGTAFKLAGRPEELFPDGVSLADDEPYESIADDSAAGGASGRSDDDLLLSDEELDRNGRG